MLLRCLVTTATSHAIIVELRSTKGVPQIRRWAAVPSARRLGFGKHGACGGQNGSGRTISPISSVFPCVSVVPSLRDLLALLDGTLGHRWESQKEQFQESPCCSSNRKKYALLWCAVM
jgi:hypothetical protein